jgi:hypothetical protein
MLGASLEIVTGRLGVGAIAFFGLFLIADGFNTDIFPLMEGIGKSVTWGIIGVLPTTVISYIVGVICVGVAESLIQLVGARSFPSPNPVDIINVSATGSDLLQQHYSEHFRNHELLLGAAVSFMILAVGCIAESGKVSSKVVSLFVFSALLLAALSFVFAWRAAKQAASIAEAAAHNNAFESGRAKRTAHR